MKKNDSYFKDAHHWYVENYEMASLNANRWFVGCLFVSILLLISLVAWIMVLPLKTLVPLVVHHHSTTGEVWVTQSNNPDIPPLDAEMQADIVRYITSRESYSASDINQRFHLVTLLSDTRVANEYEAEQSNTNSHAPINRLKKDGLRHVHIEDIVFLDKPDNKTIRHFKEAPHYLAKIDFVTTTRDETGHEQKEYWVATMSWIYKGLPNNQKDAWDNWNGFTVTAYRVDERQLTSQPRNHT